MTSHLARESACAALELSKCDVISKFTVFVIPCREAAFDGKFFLRSVTLALQYFLTKSSSDIRIIDEKLFCSLRLIYRVEQADLRIVTWRAALF